MKRTFIIFYLLTPLIVQWLISNIIQIVAVLLVPNITGYVMELTTFISAITIPVMIHLYKKDCKKRAVDNKKKFSVEDWIKVTVISVLACISLNIVISLLNLQRFSSNYQNVSEAIYLSSPVWQLVGTVLAAPIAEELIYRGVLYGRMREYVSKIPAAIFASLIFGICHGNIVQFVFAFCIGMLLCLTWEKYQQIRITIWMHMVVNVTSLALTWMINGGW